MKRFRILLLLPLAALISGCAAQRHTAASGIQAHKTALAALESQRFIIDIDEVYGKKGRKADARQSYVRMQGSFAEFCFAPDFFRPRDTGGRMDRYQASDENARFEKIRTKRNGDAQFQIQGLLEWRKAHNRSCQITLYHDSDRAYLEFFDSFGNPDGSAKGVVRPLDQ